MFQISYAVFVLVVGCITGVAFAGSKATKNRQQARLLLLGLSLLVLMGFFANFGFFWGVITIIELSVGIFVGFRLATKTEKAALPQAPLPPKEPAAPTAQPTTTAMTEPPPASSGCLAAAGYVVAFGVLFVCVSGVLSSRARHADRSASEGALAESEVVVSPSPTTSLPTVSTIDPDPSDPALAHQEPAFEVEPVNFHADVRVKVSGARYRARPFATPETPILGTAELETLLNITGQSIQDDGIWYEIQLSDGRTGYIRSDLTELALAETPDPETLTFGSGVY